MLIYFYLLAYSGKKSGIICIKQCNVNVHNNVQGNIINAELCLGMTYSIITLPYNQFHFVICLFIFFTYYLVVFDYCLSLLHETLVFLYFSCDPESHNLVENWTKCFHKSTLLTSLYLLFLFTQDNNISCLSNPGCCKNLSYSVSLLQPVALSHSCSNGEVTVFLLYSVPRNFQVPLE